MRCCTRNLSVYACTGPYVRIVSRSQTATSPPFLYADVIGREGYIGLGLAYKNGGEVAVWLCETNVRKGVMT